MEPVYRKPLIANGGKFAQISAPCVRMKVHRHTRARFLRSHWFSPRAAPGMTARHRFVPCQRTEKNPTSRRRSLTSSNRTSQRPFYRRPTGIEPSHFIRPAVHKPGLSIPPRAVLQKSGIVRLTVEQTGPRFDSQQRNLNGNMMEPYQPIRR